jgi:hypothetical protein
MTAATRTGLAGAHHLPKSFPKSLRWPWTRVGVSSVVAIMLPFTWVLQIDGCTETVEGRATGYDLVSELHFTTPDLLLALVLFVVALFAARAAWIAGGPMPRLGVHVVGLFATSILVARGISLTLGTTQIRSVQPAGLIVLVALVVAFVDAIARVGFGFMERMDERRHERARDG